MPPMLITLSIQDAGADIAPVSVYVTEDLLATVGELSSDYIEPLWDAIRPLVNGVLVGAKISVEADLSGFTNNSPTAISDVEEKGLFTFFTAPPRHASQLTLPTVLESIFRGSGALKEIDRTNSDVATFLVLMTEDLGSGGINATDSHGQSLSVVGNAIQKFGKG